MLRPRFLLTISLSQCAFVSQSVVLQIGPREAIICADTASGDMKKLKATFERCHVACSEKKRGDFSADVTQDLNKLSNAPEKHIRTYSLSVSSLFAWLHFTRSFPRAPVPFDVFSHYHATRACVVFMKHAHATHDVC